MAWDPTAFKKNNLDFIYIFPFQQWRWHKEAPLENNFQLNKPACGKKPPDIFNQPDKKTVYLKDMLSTVTAEYDFSYALYIPVTYFMAML